MVVFRQELRRLFEQIATLWFRKRLAATGPAAVDVITRSVADLVARQWGGLIVVAGREPLETHTAGGQLLGAHLSEPLLLSIFDPHSPGHDGAVISSGDRVERFQVHLPISTNRAEVGPRGTRHAAGLGLSERTDALSIIVSEERGTVSVAEAGRHQHCDAADELSEVCELGEVHG